MFTPHERTRIALCRSGFFLLCVLPTFALLFSIWRFRSPEYIDARREEWVAVLSDKLGLDISIGTLSYPDWDTALLEQVSLTDPETGRELVKAPGVEIMFTQGAWRVQADRPEVNALAIPLLTELLPDRLLRGRAVKMAPLEFAASQLTFNDTSAAQTFNHFSAFVVNVKQGRKATIQFSVAGEAAKQPLELVVERRRDGDHPRTITTFHTAENSVPLAALRTIAPWLSHFGEQAEFSGACGMETSGSNQQWEVAGEFNRVDLEKLTSSRLSHQKLTGQADIRLESLQLRNGAISLAKGTLRSRSGGEVSRALLESLGQGLDLAPAQPLPANPQGRLRYSHLAFGFQLDAQGLNLSGDADPAREGVIMASAAAGPMLIESAHPVMPAVLLIQALSPPSELQVPATRETKSWFDILPAPATLPMEETTTARRNPNLRLQK